jgi:D-alanyl-D-alanine dipeptidase
VLTPSEGTNSAQSTIRLGGHDFTFVDVITPERAATGIVEVHPQEHFVEFDINRVHKHGLGPFCKFSISEEQGQGGVYALVVGDSICYIGQTIDLKKQFNDGFGKISRSNCYRDGGQPTNCKINHRVLEVSQAGSRVDLYVCSTPASLQPSVKKQLIASCLPPWNDTLG